MLRHQWMSPRHLVKHRPAPNHLLLLSVLLSCLRCAAAAGGGTVVIRGTPERHAAAAGGGTVVIRETPEQRDTDTQLLHAFQNQSVTTILLASDYSAGTQFNEYSGPLQEGVPVININRNVTLSSLPGMDPAPMLDFQFKFSVLQLCDHCWFHLVNISVKDERMGANAQWDFFLGDGDSVIKATNVVRNRKSCTDIDTAKRLVERTQRSSRFLGPGGSTKQVYDAEDLVWRGDLFPQTLHLQNYSAEFPKHYNGGYAVVLSNVWRMCHSFVDAACLVDRDADMCVFMDIQRILTAEHDGHKGPQLSTGAVAGIVVAVLVCVLVAGACGGLLWHRKHKQQQQQHQQGSSKARIAKSSLMLPDVETGSSGLSGNSCDVAFSKDSSHKGPRAPGVFDCSPKPGSGGGSGSGCQLLTGTDGTSAGATGRGSQSTRFRSQPAWPDSAIAIASSSSMCVALCDLHFGPVLGTGSFGRVYKARLGDRDVAVKVIEHEKRMSGRVTNEVALMLSCKHANVVCAYHYVTFTTTGTQDGSDGAMHLCTTTSGGGSTTNSRPNQAADQSKLGKQPGSGSGLQQQQVQSSSSTQQQSSSTESNERQLPGSNNSMDKPIPVLPGPKVTRTCPACEREPWPAVTPHYREAACLTSSSSSRAGSPVGNGSGLAASSSVSSGGVGTSSGKRGRAQESGLHDSIEHAAKCDCSCGAHTQPMSGLLNWQHEGGFWPAGPSALLEQADPELDDDDESSMVTTWLIQEYCDSGTLGKQANSWLGSTEDDAQMIKRLLLLQDVVRGLSYLHSKNVVHGDLNSRNVLVTTNCSSSCGYTAKLADLGLSRIIKQHNTHHTTCTVGTMSHMPPELLRHGYMSTAVDIYAFGVMMWELYTREIAFRELHYGQFFETVVLRNQRPPVPPGMPEDYRVLMEHCWSAEPSARPTIEGLLKCIGLMIADRQHSLVDKDISKQQASSDSGSLNQAMMQQLAAAQQCSQQQHHQQQQHQQQQQQQQVGSRVGPAAQPYHMWRESLPVPSPTSPQQQLGTKPSAGASHGPYSSNGSSFSSAVAAALAGNAGVHHQAHSGRPSKNFGGGRGGQAYVQDL